MKLQLTIAFHLHRLALWKYKP